MMLILYKNDRNLCQISVVYENLDYVKAENPWDLFPAN